MTPDPKPLSAEEIERLEAEVRAYFASIRASTEGYSLSVRVIAALKAFRDMALATASRPAGEGEVEGLIERCKKLVGVPDPDDHSDLEPEIAVKTVRFLKGVIAECADTLTRQQAEIAEYKRRTELNPLSGYSCNGVNVWGDEKSMKAVRTAFHSHDIVPQLRSEIVAARENAALTELHYMAEGSGNRSTQVRDLNHFENISRKAKEFADAARQALTAAQDEGEEPQRSAMTTTLLAKAVNYACEEAAKGEAAAQGEGAKCSTCDGTGSVPAEIETDNGPVPCPYIGAPCPDCAAQGETTACPDCGRAIIKGAPHHGSFGEKCGAQGEGKAEPTPPKDTFREIDGRAILWTDKHGATHRCEGADFHRDVRLIWTLCHKDVPAGAAFLSGGQAISCPKCFSADMASREATTTQDASKCDSGGVVTPTAALQDALDALEQADRALSFAPPTHATRVKARAAHAKLREILDGGKDALRR